MFISNLDKDTISNLSILCAPKAFREQKILFDPYKLNMSSCLFVHQMFGMFSMTLHRGKIDKVTPCLSNIWHMFLWLEKFMLSITHVFLIHFRKVCVAVENVLTKVLLNHSK